MLNSKSAVQTTKKNVIFCQLLTSPVYFHIFEKIIMYVKCTSFQIEHDISKKSLLLIILFIEVFLLPTVIDIH